MGRCGRSEGRLIERVGRILGGSVVAAWWILGPLWGLSDPESGRGSGMAAGDPQGIQAATWAAAGALRAV